MLPPRSRPGWSEDQEENDAWVRKVWANRKREGEPAPCDCGYFEPIGLVTCDARERVKCRATAQTRLAKAIREERLKELRGRRAFPGCPFDGKGLGFGFCRWCGEEIIDPKSGKRNTRRSWCAHGRCFHQYNLHTRREYQLPFLIDRDGMGCKACGAIEGKWGAVWVCDDFEGDMERHPWLVSRWPEAAGPFHAIHWRSFLEVDHVTPLGLIAHLPPELRRPYFGPENLNLLCVACHKAKTKTDTAAIRVAQSQLFTR